MGGMLACQPEAGRVWTFIPWLFQEDHLIAYVEMIKARVEHAVFVKVNLAAIRRLDEAIAFFAKQLADFGMRRRVMRLHIVAQTAANVVLQLAPNRLKSVANRHIYIFVRTFDLQMLLPLPLHLVF